jgi:glycosyltransferase involved in cell wall biosynthesis
MIDLSILICSTHTRYQTFAPKIQEQVWPQYASLSQKDQDRVEILMLTDNKKMTLGDKRNFMVDMSAGRYVQFIDDDDRIAPDMFKSLLNGIDASDADVVTFWAEVSLNGAKAKLCKYSKDFKRDYNLPNEYRRIPNHISCVKRELSTKVLFPSIPYGEDSGYSRALLPHLRTEHKLNRVLYFYDYDSQTSETQEHQLSRYIDAG